jgi:riboflavin transporter FmnP
MTRIIITHGLISGVVIIFGILGTMTMSGGHSLWLGYLIMLVALSSILVGVKQYRDRELGGTIGFGKALLMGVGIATVASTAYMLIWEVYLALTHYTFMDQYISAILAAKRAAGVTGAAYQKAVAETDAMRAQYANPLIRMPMTFMEIFPVGLLIAFVSAALLRNARFLPARSDPGAA